MPAWDRERQATTLTKPHKLLHSLLRTMGFEVEDEVQVGRYSLDCFVREVWCGFECDGKRYHAGIAKGKKDRERDRWVYEQAGIPILRIQADALQWRLWEDLKPQITEFIERYAEDWTERCDKGRSLGV